MYTLGGGEGVSRKVVNLMLNRLAVCCYRNVYQISINTESVRN